MDLQTRAKEICSFLKGPILEEVTWRLEQGFHYNHAKVAEDFRAANPQNDEELLEWYRNTDSYIYELSAYHLDPGFNYIGMCKGVAQHLKVIDKCRVLCLGDGVGDLTLLLHQEGLNPIYHDLLDSKTYDYARFRFRDFQIGCEPTNGWIPSFRANSYDAVVALDFLEHVTEVELWVKEIYKTLRVGGQFMAQNAFAIGDSEHGDSIPMHLSRNNRFEFDWIPLLESIGFINQNNGWWSK